MIHRVLKITALAVFAALPAAVMAAPQCDTVFFSGETRQPSSPTDPFVGSMTLQNLATGQSVSTEVETALLGFTGPGAGMAVTSHSISGGGSPGIDVVTFDEAYMTPVDEATPWILSLASHIKVKSGSGAYNCGELVTDAANSTVTFGQDGLGTAEYQGLGRLCRCKPADN